MTTPARVVAWLRGLLGFSRYPENQVRHRTQFVLAPPRWVDVPVRERTAEELRADPRQARVVRRRWLERERP